MFVLAKQVELSTCTHCIVKGYHKCLFKMNIGETFYAFKKREELGNACKVASNQGQLATFKSILLVLFGPYTTRLLCKFDEIKKFSEWFV